jgi:hypothetical protein
MNSKYFIKGPIPLTWLALANRLGKGTGAVATVLWFYEGIHNGKPFNVTHRLDDVAGVSRQTRQVALKKLQQAGLIELTINRCSFPTVRIIKPD